MAQVFLLNDNLDVHGKYNQLLLLFIVSKVNRKPRIYMIHFSLKVDLCISKKVEDRQSGKLHYLCNYFLNLLVNLFLISLVDFRFAPRKLLYALFFLKS